MKMKVSITQESKHIITIEQLPIAKRMVKEAKEDMDINEYVGMACRCTEEYPVEVLKATARIARNKRIWNAYGNDTQDLDIWIDATVETTNGFEVLGVYLTEIWTITGDNNEEITSHMFIRKFKEA